MSHSQAILPAEAIAAGAAPSLSLPVLGPEPDVFARRAARLAQLAPGHGMEAYLRLCAAICRRQQALLERCDGETPPLRALLVQLAAGLDDLPAAAGDALRQLTALDDAAFERHAGQLAEGAFDAGSPIFAALPLLGAALQVRAVARQLGRTPPAPAAQGERCPCCGGLPLASLLVRGDSGHASRYAVCSLCASAWPVGRVRCLGCGNSRDLRYYRAAALDETPETATRQTPHARRGAQEVEACDACRAALKQVSRLQDPAVEPAADDLASLTLDMLAGEAGYARLGFNPLFL
ncbi:hypothetical protein CEK28_09340 [Xenophilus sp. AP218F]|nr:hypothetical protein CEK28_09340 [Xenophilus sp. AP218F]